MPTQEAIVSTVIPKEIEKPIPTRTVSTRSQKVVQEIAGQPLTNNSLVAESTAPEESVRLSPQLTALARKEQAFRQREQALKEREAQSEEDKALAAEYRLLKEKLGAKDFSAAEALGMTYDEYTNYKLAQQGEKDPRDEKIKELEARVAAREKAEEESAANLYAETIAEYKKEITREVGSNPDFSTVKGIEGGEKAVLQLILDTFEEDGEELTVLEASKLVEAKLVERGTLYTTLPKFKPAEQIEPEAPQKALPRPMVGKTLTNDMTAGSDKRPFKSLQYLSEAERYAEARRRVLERQQKG